MGFTSNHKTRETVKIIEIIVRQKKWFDSMQKEYLAH